MSAADAADMTDAVPAVVLRSRFAFGIDEVGHVNARLCQDLLVAAVPSQSISLTPYTTCCSPYPTCSQASVGRSGIGKIRHWG